MKKITTTIPNKEDVSPGVIDQIVNLINAVYDEAESGMWTTKGTRANHQEVTTHLNNKTMILAHIDNSSDNNTSNNTSDNSIVGAVVVKLMANQTGEFGSLVADAKYRHYGIGSALVKHAEQWAIKRHCTVMRLELLTPRHWTHPSKTFLKQWYLRLGYNPAQTEAFEKMHPDKVDVLATECDFTVWLKPLP